MSGGHGPEPDASHPEWCDRTEERDGRAYHSGTVTLPGERLTTKIVVEAATRILIAIEQYDVACDLHPEGVIALSYVEMRLMHAKLGRLLDQIEAAP